MGKSSDFDDIENLKNSDFCSLNEFNITCNQTLIRFLWIILLNMHIAYRIHPIPHALETFSHSFALLPPRRRLFHVSFGRWVMTWKNPEDLRHFNILLWDIWIFGMRYPGRRKSDNAAARLAASDTSLSILFHSLPMPSPRYLLYTRINTAHSMRPFDER